MTIQRTVKQNKIERLSVEWTMCRFCGEFFKAIMLVPKGPGHWTMTAVKCLKCGRNAIVRWDHGDGEYTVEECHDLRDFADLLDDEIKERIRAEGGLV